MKVICCKNCIINPICKTGCEKLLKDSYKITFKDFNIYKDLSLRLLSIINLFKKRKLILTFKHNKRIVINNMFCSFFKSGKRHREDGPATEYVRGDKHWFLNGKHHREDGPAAEYADGDKHWYINGKHHREDGPAIENSNGDKHWCINGERHREDGPAIEYIDGSKYWYINGELHREDGPAIEYINGDKEWWSDGIQIKETKNDMLQ